jgi:23S rRNA (uracil1939-C5)-methyltransferase
MPRLLCLTSFLYLCRMGSRKNVISDVLSIIDISSDGRGVAKSDGLVYFVKGAVPGDRVIIKINKKKKNLAEGDVIELVQASENRIEAFCKHFGVCGGCKWQYLAYSTQLDFKHRQIKETLERLSKTEIPELLPIAGSELQQYYRNKLDYTFSDKRWLTAADAPHADELSQQPALGFHAPGNFSKALAIEECYLQPAPSDAIRNFVFRYAVENGLEFYNVKSHTGWLRNLILRNNIKGEFMLMLAIAFADEEKLFPLLDSIKKAFPQVVSLLWIVNPKKNDTVNDLPYHVYHGQDYLVETMENLQFKIGPYSFYQTNPGQAYRLYQITREFAGLSGTETVYDLYTGTGTIALFVAAKAAKVVGVEYVPQAIEDAKENAIINNIPHADFYAGDMKDVLNDEFVKRHGKPDVIITDPPRAGMHADVVKKILEIAPQKVVYVSCNPATQARDIELMKDLYRVEKVQPVDMFPHTHHVENVVLLSLK